MQRVVSRRALFLILSLVFALPLAGALFAGHAFSEFIRFPPPLEIPRDYVRFSLLAVGGVAALLATVTLSWLFEPGQVHRRQRRTSLFR